MYNFADNECARTKARDLYLNVVIFTFHWFCGSTIIINGLIAY